MNNKVMLYKFIMLYDQAIEQRRFDDREDEYKNIHEFPHVPKGDCFRDLQIAAANVYTKASFMVVKREMKRESNYVVMNCDQPEKGKKKDIVTYQIRDVRTEAKFVVVHDDTHKSMYCCCLKLESIGYPCRHMFAVMKYKGMKEIPPGCIVQRWSKLAKANYAKDPTDENKEDDNSRETIAARRAHLSYILKPIIDIAVRSADTYTELKEMFGKLTLSVKEKLGGGCNSDTKEKKPLLGIGNPEVVTSQKGLSKKRKTPLKPKGGR